MKQFNQILAFDLGSSVGRAQWGQFNGNTLGIEEIHRFPNVPVRLGKRWYWDVLRIFEEMQYGLRKAANRAGGNDFTLGIDTRKVILKIYALSGLLCGVAALIMISRFNSAKAGYASSYLLVTILAAVLGGVDTFGGFGKMIGLVLALMILQVVSSGLNLIGISAHLTLTLWGGILIFILFINQVREWFAVRKRL